jgi:hypothetical protein
MSVMVTRRAPSVREESALLDATGVNEKPEQPVRYIPAPSVPPRDPNPKDVEL